MADFYSYRKLPPPGTDYKASFKEMAESQRKDGATFFRATFFNSTYPSDIYPPGLYMEGWKETPKDQGPFDWPMTVQPKDNTHE